MSEKLPLIQRFQWRARREKKIAVGIMVGMGIMVVTAAAAPPLVGVDWNVRVVDGTGTAFGTNANPIFTAPASGGGTPTVQGSLTNNNAAPGATNVGVLPALANAAVPSWTEGNQVLLSANLAGALRSAAEGPTAAGGAVSRPPVLAGQNGAGGVVRFLTEANAVAPSTGTGLLGVGSLVFDGTNWQKPLGTATGGAAVQGPAAAGAALAGNPVLQGMSDGTSAQSVRNVIGAQGTTGAGLMAVGPLHQAVTLGTSPASVTAGQMAYSPATRGGIPIEIGGHPNIITVRAAFTTAQTDTALVTVSTGTKIVVTSEMVTCSNANTASPSVIIGFGTANTPTTTGVVISHPGIAPGSGVGKGNGGGIIGIGADDEDLRITSSVPTGGSIECVTSYFTTPS